jgi:hypothetical protein
MLHAPEIGFQCFGSELNVVHAAITWQRMLEQDLPKFSRKHKSGLT